MIRSGHLSRRCGSLVLLAAIPFLPAACSNGGIPALGINSCQLNGIGLGAAAGALAGGLIGHDWKSAVLGGAAGGALGFLGTKVFAHQLGCDDQERLVQQTQLAATSPTGRRAKFVTKASSDGKPISGYVLPTSSWYTDPEGRKVRDVQQVLTNGADTQTSTVQVAANEIPPPNTPGRGTVLPK